MTSKTCWCGRIIAVGAVSRCEEHERTYQAGRQVRRRGYSSRAWKQLRDSVRRRGACEDCGTAGALTVHHRIPVAEGGALLCAPDLLVLVCDSCHGKRERGQVDVGAPPQLIARYGKKAAQPDDSREHGPFIA